MALNGASLRISLLRCKQCYKLVQPQITSPPRPFKLCTKINSFSLKTASVTVKNQCVHNPPFLQQKGSTHPSKSNRYFAFSPKLLAIPPDTATADTAFAKLGSNLSSHPTAQTRPLLPNKLWCNWPAWGNGEWRNNRHMYRNAGVGWAMSDGDAPVAWKLRVPISIQIHTYGLANLDKRSI